jgi:signal transduction histidine kinase
LREKYKYLSLILVSAIVFFAVFLYLKREYGRIQYTTIDKIEKKLNKIEEKLLKTRIYDLKNYQIFDNKTIKIWKGEILINDISKIPNKRFFIIDNETGIFLLFKNNNHLKIIKLANYNFYTQEKNNEILKMGMEEVGINIDYIDFFNFEKQEKVKYNFKNKSIIKGKYSIKKIVKSKKGLPLIIIKTEKPDKTFIIKKTGEKLFYLLYIYYFISIFYFIFIIKGNESYLFFYLLILKIIQLFFYRGDIIYFFLPINSIIGVLSWLILLYMFYEILKKRFFIFIFNIFYSLLLLLYFFRYRFQFFEKIYNIYPCLFIISSFLILLFIEFKDKKRKKSKIIVSLIFLIFINIFFYEYYFKINQEKYLDYSIKKIDKIVIEKDRIIKDILKDYNFEIIKKSFNNDFNIVALSIFEKFVQHKIGHILPSILIMGKDENILSYFSLSAPLPDIPIEFFKENYTVGETFFKVRNFKLYIKYYRKIIVVENDKKIKIIVFFIKDKLKLIKDTLINKNRYIYNKYLAIYHLDAGVHYKLLKRDKKLFLIKIKDKIMKGVFYNNENEQYFIGFPIKDFFYYYSDIILISLIIFLSFSIIYFLKYFRKQIHYSSFKVNFFIISLPLILSIVFQILFVNFFVISNNYIISKENKNKAEILKKTIPFLSELNFNDKELCFYLHKISNMEILLFEGKKLKFFSGILNGYNFNTIPYEIYYSLKKDKRGMYVRKINDLINIYFFTKPEWKNKFFGVFLRNNQSNSSVYIKFFNKSIFYSTIILFLVILVSMLFSSKFKEGINKIIEGLNLIKEGEIKSIEYDDSGEIGEVVKSFNKMVDNIKEQRLIIKDLTEKEALLKVARRVAHEIKNPLTPIKLNIEYLNSLKNSDKEEFENSFSELMSSTINEINKLEKVVKDFLNFSKEGVPPLYNFNINEFIKNIVLIFKGTEVAFEIEGEEEIFVYANEDYLETAIKNLIINAIEAMDRIKKIKITIGKTKNKKCEIKIRDYGKGISDDEIDNIFKSGFSTKRGSGLGLSIVREIIEKLNGEIKILSWKDEGTLAIIKLLEGEGE